MPPAWLTILGWSAIGIGATSAAWVVYDLVVVGHRQQMRVMAVVWPVTALYFGPVAVWGCRRFGWPKSPQWRREHGYDDPPERPGWSSVAVGVSHCGAGCSLGDLIAKWCVFAVGATVAGLSLIPEYIGDYILALSLGVAFQYFAIAPMRDLGVGKGLVEAAKADVLAQRVRGRPLRVDGAHAAGVVPRPAPRGRPCRLLVLDADRHGARLLHGLAGGPVAHPGRDQRGHVTTHTLLAFSLPGTIPL